MTTSAKLTISRTNSARKVAATNMTPNGVIRAITLYQPWASLMAIGAKKIETRTWRSFYKGPIAIHSSLRVHVDELPTDGSTRRRMLDALLPHLPEFDRPHRVTFRDVIDVLPLGCILGIGNLTACLPTGGFATWPVTGMPVETDDEWWFGNYQPGRYAWKIENVIALPEPIPARGLPSVWDWTYPPQVLRTPAGALIRGDR